MNTFIHYNMSIETFYTMTQLSLSIRSQDLLSTSHCTIRSLNLASHWTLALVLPSAEPTELSHSRLQEPRIWRCAPGGGTRTRTASRPGWRRSLCSTAAGQCRGLRRGACSGSRGDREERASAAGSARSDCAARWSRLRAERRRERELLRQSFHVHPLPSHSSFSSSTCVFEFLCEKKSDFHTLLTLSFWVHNRNRVLFCSTSFSKM